MLSLVNVVIVPLLVKFVKVPSLDNVVIVSLLINFFILLISDNLSKSYTDVLLTKFVIVL